LYVAGHGFADGELLRVEIQGASLTARHLLTLFDSVYLAALAVWIGGAIFCTFALGPVLFKALGTESARAMVRAVYPRYYSGGAISGAVALASFVAGPLCFQEYRRPMVAVQALAIIGVTLLMLYGGNTLTPAICTGDPGGAPNTARIEQWRRRDVVINVLVLLIGLTLLVAHVARPAPTTSGIIELTPRERPGYDAAISRAIEDAEIKYGFRPPRPEGSGEIGAPDPVLDLEAVRELESIYAKKRLRDQARAGKDLTKGTPP
jgi:uncharacterized membrane protein